MSVGCIYLFMPIPDSKVHGANMGPIWGRQDPGGPHGGPKNLTIWDIATAPDECYMLSYNQFDRLAPINETRASSSIILFAPV